MEEWKAIPGYEGIYEVSNLGRIRSSEGKTTSNNYQHKRVWKQRILKPHITKRPSGKSNLTIQLYKDGKKKQFLIPRLVAMVFCDGYREDLTVNHIDGNTLNNAADNLEWLSFGENTRHAYRTGLNAHAKKCTLKNKSGVFKFYSLQEASRFLGRQPKYLSSALKKGTRIYASNGDEYDFA